MMFDLSHHHALYISYGSALAGWCLAFSLWPKLWPAPKQPSFHHPWREVGWALVACLAIIGIGQFYVRNWLLPKMAALGPLIEVANQAIIFAPIGFLLLWRCQGMDTIWLPKRRIPQRLAVGFGLALVALLAFTLVRQGSDSWPRVAVRVFHPGNVGIAAQVFFEDVAIALLAVRLSAALRHSWSVPCLVGLLFSAGHIPSMLAAGNSVADLSPLLLDFGLVAGVLFVVQRSGDIFWIWCVHFSMDMSQFAHITGIAE